MMEIQTITPLGWLGLLGVVSGTAAFLLGVAQLTCEHGASPWPQRITTTLLAMIAGYTAVDSWEFWEGLDEPLDVKAVFFCAALALSWGYRRTFGFTSHRRPPVAH